MSKPQQCTTNGEDYPSCCECIWVLGFCFSQFGGYLLIVEAGVLVQTYFAISPYPVGADPKLFVDLVGALLASPFELVTVVT